MLLARGAPGDADAARAALARAGAAYEALGMTRDAARAREAAGPPG
jgi:outer membrane protein assembly factor BamD (BamD/ComL family)